MMTEEQTAEAWAAMARAEGHRRRLPDNRNFSRSPDQSWRSERAAVVRAVILKAHAEGNRRSEIAAMVGVSSSLVNETIRNARGEGRA